jgi:TPR repeat protein
MREEGELHDIIQQRLVATAVDLDLVRAKLERVPTAGLASMGEAPDAKRAQAHLPVLDEAEQWFRKAAAAGYHTAQYNLGLLLCKQDRLEEAEQWFRKAASSESEELAVRARQAIHELHSGGRDRRSP